MSANSLRLWVFNASMYSLLLYFLNYSNINIVCSLLLCFFNDVLLYFSIPFFVIAYLLTGLAGIVTKNIGFAQWVLTRVLFPFQWLFLGCWFSLELSSIKPEKKTLLFVNHPSYFDVMPIFWWADKYNRTQDLIFVGKESITKIPIIGNIIKKSHLMINRDYDTDKVLIENFCNRLNDNDKSYIFVIFPEGTTYSKDTIQKSHKYTSTNSLENFLNVLCPKTRGADLILKHLKPDIVLDMTIVYNDYANHYRTMNGIPFSSFRGLIMGEYPMYTHINVKNVSNEMLSENANVPDELMKIWRQKDDYITSETIQYSINSSIDKIIRFCGIIVLLNGMLKST